MNKKCVQCRKDADYVIQWGAQDAQREFVCEDHVPDFLSRVPAIEFFVVKIKKLDKS